MIPCFISDDEILKGRAIDTQERSVDGNRQRKYMLSSTQGSLLVAQTTRTHNLSSSKFDLLVN